MAYLDEINVQGTDYDIRDKRIAGTEDVNVKPIYFHGIEFRNTTDAVFAYAHVLNNSITTFTLADFVTWMTSISAKVIVPLNGTVKVSGNKVRPICLYKESGSTEINLEYANATNDVLFEYNIDLVNYFPQGISDGVNKVN